MRIAYTLEESDLEAVILQQSLRRRDRIRGWFEGIRRGPLGRHLLVNAGVGIAIGLLLAPAWFAVIGPLQAPLSPVGLYAITLAIALVIATAIQRFRRPPQPSLAGFYRWSARRQLARVRPRNVFGPVELSLTEAGIVRINATGELSVPWSDVREVLASPSMLTMKIPGNRVFAAPRRAFADEAEAAAFRAEVERRSGHKAIPVADAP